MDTSTVDDFRALDLDTESGIAQLNQYIARRKGFTVYHYDKDFESRCYYMLMDAGFDPAWASFDGVRFGGEAQRGMRAGQRKTEAEAWADSPQWANEEALALALVEADHDFVLIHRPGKGWAASFDGAYLLVSEPERYWRDDQKALAVTYAWCEWDELHPRREQDES